MKHYQGSSKPPRVKHIQDYKDTEINRKMPNELELSPLETSQSISRASALSGSLSLRRLKGAPGRGKGGE
jgi:hypothetical protein